MESFFYCTLPENYGGQLIEVSLLCQIQIV